MSTKSIKRSAIKLRTGVVLAVTLLLATSIFYQMRANALAATWQNIQGAVALASLQSSNSSLHSVEVPQVKDIEKYVANKDATILLGKAFFWDMAAGSDGQACGSCHFHAGADDRVKNQLTPGLNAQPEPDTTFQQTASGGTGGPNYTLIAKDFPFHQFENPNDRNSGVKFTTNDAVSSQGTFGGNFVGLFSIEDLEDYCDQYGDPIFHVSGIGVRKVEPRNTPTMINAVFNFRNFWDGRANNVFNGVDPFGLRNSSARVLLKDGSGVKQVQVDLRNSSLASQAVAPPVSEFEMVCTGRKFAQLGQKLLPRRALARQAVHPQDSVLGTYRDASGYGLNRTYTNLIQQAFKREFWETPGTYDGFTQIESNFSLFWGLSLQTYQATLISDQAPFDKFAEGDSSALSSFEKQGFEIFEAKCASCHSGPEFTDAATNLQTENNRGGLVERMRTADGGIAIYDHGFYNIGVTPTNEDLGVGGEDPFGNPLSFAKQYISGVFVDPFYVDPCSFDEPFNVQDCKKVPTDLSNHRLDVNGAFKVPGLRNVELTGPYMHNGSMATLDQVLEFYNRGGNFRNPELHPDIQPLGLNSEERAAVVAFLKTLTDPRVRNESAPFDHPQLLVPNGHPGDEHHIEQQQSDWLAADDQIEIRAVGKNGRSAEGLPPLQPFQYILPKQAMVAGCGLQVTQTCTVADRGLSSQCSASLGSPVVCGLNPQKPTSFTFRYLGGGCSATTNSQNGKVVCSGRINPATGVNIIAGKKDLKADNLYIVTPSYVQPGEEFTIQPKAGKTNFEADSAIQLTNAGGSEMLILKADCSQAINLGNDFGSLSLVGANGKRFDKFVNFSYRVTNYGANASNVTLTDDLFGSIATPFTLPSGGSQTFERSSKLYGSVYNSAQVTGATNAFCAATVDTVEVRLEAEPLSCIDGKPTQLVFEYTGAACAVGSNSQGSKFKCSGNLGSGNVSIVVTKDTSKFVVTPNKAKIGDLITISSSENAALKDLKLTVGGQSMELVTSCSAPLVVGETFGGLALRSYVPLALMARSDTPQEEEAAKTSVYLPLVTR